jgi:hypothetical protein
VGNEGYFSLPRACRFCAGQNVVELNGAAASAVKRRRGRRRASTTQKIKVLGSRR